MADQTTRILHVDDEPGFSELVKRSLEREDETFEVITETSPEDGLDQLENHSVDCVVSSYEMPETDGLAFLDAVQQSYPGTPFILFTGKGSEEIASTAISRGVTDYVQKSGGTEQYEVLANRIRNSVDRQRTERERQRNRELISRVLDVTPAAILVLDDAGQIIRANERAGTILNRSNAELTSRTFDGSEWEIVDENGDVIPDDALPFTRVRETGSPVYGVEHGVRQQDGSVVWLSINAAPLRDNHGAIEHVVAVLSDITAQKRQTETLNTTVTQLEQFGAAVSRNIGDILRIAQNRLKLARETEEAAYSGVVDESVNRAVEMVDELTTAMQAGTLVENVSTVEVGTVFNRAWSSQATENATSEVEREIRIQANETALLQLLELLINNSLERGDDTVTVRVGPLTDGFYVEDNGPKLPETEREKLIEPGYTTEEARTGAGLVSVHQIALAHGWELTVGDGAEGGTRFSFTGVDVDCSAPTR